MSSNAVPRRIKAIIVRFAHARLYARIGVPRANELGEDETARDGHGAGGDLALCVNFAFLGPPC